MESTTLFAINLSTLIIIIFSAHLLCLRAFERQTYLPLAVFLFSIGIIICQPTLAYLADQLRPTMIILSLPAILLTAPSLWFYVEGITAKTPWQLSQMNKKHFILFMIGAVVAFVALFISYDVQYALLVNDDDSIFDKIDQTTKLITITTLLATVLLVLAWIAQSGFYLYKVIKRLTQYRAHLKNLFASTEAKEVRWISWLLLAVAVVWAATAANIIVNNILFSNEVNATVSGLIILVMTWSVAIWGLRQKPGFEEIYDADEEIQQILEDVPPQSEKYQRSALNNQNAVKIAEKIALAMQQDQLYLDASLSLQKLAKHINTSPNYISQTLNETLGANFFDYINQYRINEAKKQLKETKNTVLDIAMNVGFNAKSSFYTAFKKEIQQTPSQYRKSET
ncbi:AraC family transcriptional regulator [Pseudoalteromonas sp. C2R02]|uniref:helix-turn-helix domain-containing protein n=1 Tax=Pseudoalteromonas sp. C2R02 TaxID=2841565 RepID=UPI001C082B87|nr:AraC family transcriptional regulator [Pseudoalteromonas sp. C2R02]MBU2972573.1 AraC family transcriptional regulator [Pseudoalteromonas sp. C2R02]